MKTPRLPGALRLPQDANDAALLLYERIVVTLMVMRVEQQDVWLALSYREHDRHFLAETLGETLLHTGCVGVPPGQMRALFSGDDLAQVVWNYLHDCPAGKSLPFLKKRVEAYQYDHRQQRRQAQRRIPESDARGTTGVAVDADLPEVPSEERPTTPRTGTTRQRTSRRTTGRQRCHSR